MGQIDNGGEKKIVIDPPMGSRYGFPRIYDKQEGESVEEWFLRRGYPKELIEQGMLNHCRWWDWKPDKEEKDAGPGGEGGEGEPGVEGQGDGQSNGQDG